jgi:hypothetical protein
METSADDLLLKSKNEFALKLNSENTTNEDDYISRSNDKKVLIFFEIFLSLKTKKYIFKI